MHQSNGCDLPVASPKEKGGLQPPKNELISGCHPKMFSFWAPPQKSVQLVFVSLRLVLTSRMKQYVPSRRRKWHVPVSPLPQTRLSRTEQMPFEAQLMQRLRSFGEELLRGP